jgi:hypothetical protein
MARVRALLFCILCSVSILFIPGEASARNIDRFLSGSWYNPAQNGHGFSIEIGANGLVVIYWYVYHPDGTPMFILAVGQASGMSVTATAYYNTGMRFGVFDPSERMESEWGSITITFHNCNSATVEYDSDFVHGGQPFGSGSFPIQKLVTIDQLECQEDRRAGIYEGIVFSALDGREYYGFALVAPGGEFAVYSEGGVAAFGTIQVNGISLTASGTAVSLDPNNLSSGAINGDGDFSAEYRLFSFYEIAGGDEGFGDFYAVPALYRRPISMGALAGTYEVANPVTGFGGTAIIMNNGNLTGMDELGCQYAGHVSIPDTRFNIFEISLTVSSCPGFNATYQGLGEQIDWNVVEDRRGLRVLASDGNWGFLLLGNK